jgi:hypothetical protein
MSKTGLIYRIGLCLRRLVEASPYGKIRVLLETVALRGRAPTQPSRIKPSVQPRRWDPDSSPLNFAVALLLVRQRKRKKQVGICMEHGVWSGITIIICVCRNLELQWKLSKCYPNAKQSAPWTLVKSKTILAIAGMGDGTVDISKATFYIGPQPRPEVTHPHALRHNAQSS